MQSVSLRFVWLLVILCGCKKKAPEALFTLLPAQETGIAFSNEIRQTDSLNILKYMYFYNGGGVGLGDINNDGLTDIFFSGNMVSSRLYLNKGNMQFEDITAQAGLTTTGWCTGVSMVDLNADGWLDIYVSKAGSPNPSQRANLLFINKGNNTFKESAEAYGLADTGYTTQAAFLDYDQDGDLDVYLLSHDHSPRAVNNLMPVRTHGEAANTDKLFLNEGTGVDGHPVFKNVSAQAGILFEGYGLGVAVNDLNGDNWPDIYVANDFLSNDLLYINNHDGTFTNRIGEYMKHQSYNAMGVDVADYNNDGFQDVVVLDMLPEDNYRQKIMAAGMSNEKFDFMLQMGYQPQYMRNTLQLNNGSGHFSEIGQLAGIDKTDWSWGPLFADFDNDGYRDLFISNGHLKDMTDKDFIKYSQQTTMFEEKNEANAKLLRMMQELKGVKVPNYVFRNNGDLTFTHAKDWGISQLSFSNGASYADLDNDGDLDLVVNNVNEKAFIYKNESQKVGKNNWLQLSLNGDKPNRLGLGTKVTLRYHGQIQVYEHTLYRGFQSTVGNTIHFGLGRAGRVDTLEVRWPDGQIQQLTGVAANQRLVLDYKNAHTKRPVLKQDNPVFTEVSHAYGLDYTHAENKYADVATQLLMPQTYSTIGPSMAVGDIDGNGLDDLFMGGAAGLPATYFLQQANGRFVRQVFGADKEHEDAGILLFDADGDGDNDLYMASGGDEFEAGTALYQDRLYINDGTGRFTRDTLALPLMRASKSCVTAADFDQDGDPDLFVGGRIVPGQYPSAPESYVLRNDSGKFTDVTAQVCGELRHIGMVTSALWTDFDDDGRTDLLVAGEWVPVTFFKNKGGKLVNVTRSAGLGETSGWWNSMAGADMDNDGDTDYILGNLGTNTPFQASAQEPLTMHSGNLDGSGLHQSLLSWYIQGKNYPWPSRDALLRQMPRIGKKFFLYDDYAKATVQDVVSPELLHKAAVLKSSCFQSSYLENLGKGKFRLRPLPVQAQFAPVHGIVVRDIDDDGNLDLILSGNSYAPDASIGRYDAMQGLCLKGDGRGNFAPVPSASSGLALRGDGRSLAELLGPKGNVFLIGAANGGKLEVYVRQGGRKPELVKTGRMENKVMLVGKGRRRKVELYDGSGYLSQSSRFYEVPEGFRVQPAGKFQERITGH
ncbi:VCBS repeat-containing protein [Dyadobacter sandarakinus]|uniref:VCBS repeat-containing protein n=1 Tax=Dyadobacter sandarakinus TaxID=2747268 RepID=A0ABX7I6B8_9BACT|nr:VCBS repeat-containing protein [Dyadobacter sandarakinus]QRR01330.1 VCBS repeat-containing protein [Dyadobacter sandarakinus]